MFLHPKATSCPEGNVLLSVRWPWSSPLVSFMFYAGNCSDINSYNARKTFLPLLKIVYKLPSLFMNLFFCFILSAWSCLASFCSHWAIIDGASFLLFLGMLFCEACSIAPAVSVAHGPPAAFDSFAVAGILWGTLPQLVLLAEWLCTVVGAAHMHTHARTHAGWCIYRNGIAQKDHFARISNESFLLSFSLPLIFSV